MLVNGACIYGLAVVKSLWTPTGTYWKLVIRLGSKCMQVCCASVASYFVEIARHQYGGY